MSIDTLRKPANPARTALTLLAICFLLHAAIRGVMEAYPVFLLPLSADFGWSRAQVSSVYSVAFLVFGLSGPMIGWLFDRFGPLRLLLAGVLIASLSAVVASQVTALWQVYLSLGILLGLGTACVGYVPMTALLSRWFRERLNSALAVSHSSHGLGMLMLAPTTQLLIDWDGWRSAYLVLGIGLLILLPVFFTVKWRTAAAGHPAYRRDTPKSDDRPADAATLAEAARHPAAWGIFWSFLFTSTAMFSISLQTPAYLVEIGYTAQDAAEAFGLVGLLLPIGMVGFGWLGDRIGRRRAVLLSYALTLGGMACMAGLQAGPSPVLLAGLVIMFGGTFGSRGPAVSTIAATIFQGPQFGRIYGFITMGMGIGGALGAWLGGFLLDLTGGYQTGIAVSMASIVLAALPFLFVRSIARG